MNELRLLLNFKRILENIFLILSWEKITEIEKGKFSFLFDLKSNLNPALTQDCIRFSNSQCFSHSFKDFNYFSVLNKDADDRIKI